MYPATTYAVYLLVSIALTIWVARTLFRNGRVFLVDAFSGNTEVADSVNQLLVVGFYLLNIGYVTTVLRFGTKPRDLVEAIEYTSTKVGMVLLVLGAMHFLNLLLFSKARKREMFTHKNKKAWMETNYTSKSMPAKTRKSDANLLESAKDLEGTENTGTSAS